ncbi:MAG: hypothetical protein IPG07_08925 [Crocinitomicaceae bacterium]|nr:hypothetical protein [Crocinitomicaceae bacterium]
MKRGDTSFIPYFNIGPYQVMPFETNLSWQTTIPGQKDDFHFFTELDNFNILANSIPAMRWYLGELQLGNLLMKNEQLYRLYCESLRNVLIRLAFNQAQTKRISSSTKSGSILLNASLQNQFLVDLEKQMNQLNFMHHLK